MSQLPGEHPQTQREPQQELAIVQGRLEAVPQATSSALRLRPERTHYPPRKAFVLRSSEGPSLLVVFVLGLRAFWFLFWIFDLKSVKAAQIVNRLEIRFEV